MAIQPPTNKQKKKYKRYLAHGEEIVIITGVSNRYYFILLPVFVFFAFLLIGMPKLVHHMVEKRAKLYIFTNKRVLLKDGIFSIKITSASYGQIANISVKEPFFRKLLFDTGSIEITTTSGDYGTSQKIILKNIGSPMEIKNMLETLITHHHHDVLPSNIRKQFLPEEAKGGDIPRFRG